MVTATQPAIYTSAEVCRQTGITYKQLDTWSQWRYIQPSFVTRESEPKPWHGRGSGHDRRFTQAEVEVARMMARLVKLGVNAQQAAKVARHPTERWAWLGDVFAAAKDMP
jgi:DNA-binding transcriptional MerR regulator